MGFNSGFKGLIVLLDINMTENFERWFKAVFCDFELQSYNSPSVSACSQSASLMKSLSRCVEK